MPVLPMRKQTWDPDDNLAMPERRADDAYCTVRDKTLGVAAAAKYIATWADVDNDTFDASDAIVRLMRDVGGSNAQHLRGYQPPADLAILDAVGEALKLLENDRLFQRQVPGMPEARRIMLGGLNAIGQTTCIRIAAHGDVVPRDAMARFGGKP